jgi:hypothetical protein
MYITPLKSILVEALKTTFDALYPNPDFRGEDHVHIGMEYPIDPQNYPAVWVDYEDTQDLIKAGIAHLENVDPDTNTLRAPFTRWRFQGYVSLTVVAMTSLERDRLFDEIVRVVAFGQEDDVVGRFHTYINTNDLIAANLNTDKVQPRGAAAAPGTPWSTDELMYERSLNLEIVGEFIPDVATSTLVPLSRILLLPTVDVSGDLGDPPLDTMEMGVWH